MFYDELKRADGLLSEKNYKNLGKLTSDEDDYSDQNIYYSVDTEPDWEADGRRKEFYPRKKEELNKMKVFFLYRKNPDYPSGRQYAGSIEAERVVEEVWAGEPRLSFLIGKYTIVAILYGVYIDEEND